MGTSRRNACRRSKRRNRNENLSGIGRRHARLPHCRHRFEHPLPGTADTIATRGRATRSNRPPRRRRRSVHPRRRRSMHPRGHLRSRRARPSRVPRHLPLRRPRHHRTGVRRNPALHPSTRWRNPPLRRPAVDSRRHRPRTRRGAPQSRRRGRDSRRSAFRPKPGLVIQPWLGTISRR